MSTKTQRACLEYEHADGYMIIRTFPGRTLPAMPGFDGAWRIAQGATSTLRLALVDGERNDTAHQLASGWTCTAKARKGYGDTTALFTATATLSNQLPNIVLTLTPSTTANLDFTGGVLDVELTHTDSGITAKVLACPVALLKEAV